jgi:hypothetical protein
LGVIYFLFEDDAELEVPPEAVANGGFGTFLVPLLNWLGVLAGGLLGETLLPFG